MDSQLYYGRQIRELEYAGQRMAADGYKSGLQCGALYTELQVYYKRMKDITGDTAYDARLQWAKDKAHACPN